MNKKELFVKYGIEFLVIVFWITISFYLEKQNAKAYKEELKNASLSKIKQNILYEKEIVRIRDVYVKFYDTLELEDQIIQNMFKDKFTEESFTTAEFCNVLGKISKEKS